MKYTLDDFIKLDVIVKCNYTEAKLIANKLRQEGFDTSVIDDIVKVTDSTFYLGVYKDALCQFDEEDCRVRKINFEDLELLIVGGLYKEFEVGEIVHAVIDAKEEPFNPFARDKHVTAYVACVDKINHMCELVYLHDTHKSVWLHFRNIFHIQSIYDDENIDEQVTKKDFFGVTTALLKNKENVVTEDD